MAAAGTTEGETGKRDATPDVDQFYTCISKLITAKAFEKALLLEQIREAEERALLAEKGKEEVSSSIQASIPAHCTNLLRKSGRLILLTSYF